MNVGPAGSPSQRGGLVVVVVMVEVAVVLVMVVDEVRSVHIAWRGCEVPGNPL
jgi:hypothetical protein